MCAFKYITLDANLKYPIFSGALYLNSRQKTKKEYRRVFRHVSRHPQRASEVKRALSIIFPALQIFHVFQNAFNLSIRYIIAKSGFGRSQQGVFSMAEVVGYARDLFR
jgi:hypothetical protein